jgi:hypothetical protein
MKHVTFTSLLFFFLSLYPLLCYPDIDFNPVLGSIHPTPSSSPQKEAKKNYFFGKNRLPDVVENLKFS